MKKEISWKAPTHIFFPKTNDWYWIVAIIFVTTAIISIMLDNIIFAIFILMSIFFVFSNAHKEPEIIDIVLNNKGVKVGKEIYFYNELDSFWVENGNLHPRILFKHKSKLSTFITVLIHEDDSDEIRNFLNQYIHEEHMNENILEKIFIYFGF
jgi:hypothetical protein